MCPRCVHYEPTMRPQGAHYVHKLFRSGSDGPKVRPVCAHYAPAISINRFGVEPMGPKGPTMRPLGAHHAPTMSRNRFGVEPMGP
jgi:hypothetical protein